MGAQGTATVDFGAFPGSVEAQADVTGQTGFTSSSLVEAWVMPVATSDHSADEHLIEQLDVTAVYKVDGTFTLRAFEDHRTPQDMPLNSGQAQSNRLYGQYTIGWVWN